MKQNKPQWEEEFQRKWKEGDFHNELTSYPSPKRLESFISELLKSRDDEIVGWVEENKKKEASIPNSVIRGDSYRMGYNKALQDLLDFLKKRG